MNSRIRVLLVDDDEQLLSTMPDLVSQASPRISFVGRCRSGEEALQAVQRGLEFEVGLIDLALPDLDGQRLISSLLQERPDATFIACTILEQPQAVFSALEAGACGYMLKNTKPARLASAIEEALTGGAPLTPTIARMVVDSFNRNPRPEQRELSARERDVLRLLAQGDSYAAVAKALGIGLGTVQTHVKNIYRKLRVSTKAAAGRWARSAGLAPPR